MDGLQSSLHVNSQTGQVINQNCSFIFPFIALVFGSVYSTLYINPLEHRI